MSNLNNQNYCLQKELEEFVHADDAVRMNLDRKHKVENIRTRVDEVIARSQAEVARTMIPPARVFHHEYPSVEKMDRLARKTVSSYSPMRPEPIIERRVAWRGLDDGSMPPPQRSYVEMRKQYSFGRGEPAFDEWARQEREYRDNLVGRRERGSPLREGGRSKSGTKNVSFA